MRSPSLAFGVADAKIGQGAGAWRRVEGAPAASGQEPPPESPSSIEVVSAEELVRLPATPYAFVVNPGGQITPDAEVLEEFEKGAAVARSEITRRLALTPRKEVFLFIHGVGNTFEDAVTAAAEYWHFLGREGLPIAYTWPAGAKGLLFYTVDRESGEFTILHLKQFLRILADIPEVEKIHIAAHSRGTDVATSALRELIIESRSAGEDPRQKYKIENLVLVAADLDIEVAMQRVVGEALGPAVGRLTLYTNTRDSALASARFLFASRLRVGAVNPTALTPRKRGILQRPTNLDLILYEGRGGGLFRHSYFRDPVASSDMLMLLRFGWGPGEGKRRGLEALGTNMWRITVSSHSDG
jgi:hypothetical protein